MVKENIKEIPTREEQLKKEIIRWVTFGVLGLIFIIILFGAFYTIDAGERGVLLTMGKLSNNIAQPGLNFKIPLIQRVVKMSVRTQTVSFDNKQGSGDNSEYSSLFGASKDLQNVQIGSVINYRINEQDVLDIYRKYGDEVTYQKNILEPIIRETVKTVSAGFNAEELVTKRAEFSDKVAKSLTDKFAEKSGVFEKYDVVNFQFSDEYTKAIESKAVVMQQKLQSEVELEKTKIDAEKRIAQAEGDAKAIQIQMESLKQNGGDNYIRLKSLENQAKYIEVLNTKWDGKYPITLVGSQSDNLLLQLPSTLNNNVIKNQTI